MRTALGTFGNSKGPVWDEDDDRRRRVASIVEDAERTGLRVFKTLLTAAPSMAAFWQAPVRVHVVRVVVSNVGNGGGRTCV